MPTKFSTVKRRKRRFCGNQYTKKREKDFESSSTCEDDSQEEKFRPRKDNVGKEVSQPAILKLATPPKLEESPSARKLGEYHSIGYSSQGDDSASIGANDGFRLVDISILASRIHMLLCPMCRNSKICLKEDEKAKMGFPTHFTLFCSNHECLFQ